MNKNEKQELSVLYESLYQLERAKRDTQSKKQLQKITMWENNIRKQIRKLEDKEDFER